MSETYSLDYLKKEVCDFRRLLGQKSFWALPQPNRQGALDGLGIVYLRLDPVVKGEELEFAAAVYSGAVEEYQRREIMLISLGKSPSR